jgi:hypothetical protein
MRNKQNTERVPRIQNAYKVKLSVCLIKYYAMKAYGRVDI